MTVAIDHLEHQLAAYRALGRQIEELREMQVRVRQAIVEALGDNDTGTIGNRPVVRYTRFTQRRLSPSLVRKRFTEDELAECYVETSMKKLTIVPP